MEIIFITLFWLGIGFVTKQWIWKWGRKVEKTSQRYLQYISFVPFIGIQAGLTAYARTARIDEAAFQFALVAVGYLVVACIGAAIHDAVKDAAKPKDTKPEPAQEVYKYKEPAKVEPIKIEQPKVEPIKIEPIKVEQPKPIPVQAAAIEQDDPSTALAVTGALLVVAFLISVS